MCAICPRSDTILIHKMIYEIFKDIALANNMKILHKDYNKQNNCIDNLELIMPEQTIHDNEEYILKLPDDAIELPDNFT